MGTNARDFDEIEELSLLLSRDELLDIEEVLEETFLPGKYSYMTEPVQLTCPDRIKGREDLEGFIEQVNGLELPRLNWAGQRKAWERAQRGDSQAAKELVVTGIPWVWRIAANYGQVNPDEFLDYFQEGVLGLMEAIRRWDPQRGNLATYASSWIMQRIGRYISNAGSPLRHPIHLQEKRKRVIMEIEATGKIPADIKALDLASWLPPVSLNSDLTKLLGSSIQEQVLSQLEDPLPSDEYFFEDIVDHSNYEEVIINKTYLQGVREWLWNSGLTEREKVVLAHRYGLSPDGREKTLEEVGALIGLTRERIRQIEAKALRKLRHPRWASAVKVKDNCIIVNRKHGSNKITQPLLKISMDKRNMQVKTVGGEQFVADRGADYSCEAPQDIITDDSNPPKVILEVFRLFREFFGVVPQSKSDLYRLLNRINIMQNTKWWQKLLSISLVRETLTTKQVWAIKEFTEGQSEFNWRTRGLMERAVIRIYSKILSYEQWRLRNKHLL